MGLGRPTGAEDSVVGGGVETGTDVEGGGD